MAFEAKMVNGELHVVIPPSELTVCEMCSAVSETVTNLENLRKIVDWSTLVQYVHTLFELRDYDKWTCVYPNSEPCPIFVCPKCSEPLRAARATKIPSEESKAMHALALAIDLRREAARAATLKRFGL